MVQLKKQGLKKECSAEPLGLFRVKINDADHLFTWHAHYFDHIRMVDNAVDLITWSPPILAPTFCTFLCTFFTLVNLFNCSFLFLFLFFLFWVISMNHLINLIKDLIQRGKYIENNKTRIKINNSSTFDLFLFIKMIKENSIIIFIR